MKIMSNLFLIVAGGIGSRFEGTLPKQYCNLAGRPMIYHTVDAIRRASRPDDTVAVVTSPDMSGLVASIQEEYGQLDALIIPVAASTRAATVANALRATGDMDVELIAVHDSARPLVKPEMVKRLIYKARQEGIAGAIPAVKLTDSIRRLTGPDSSVAADRDEFRAVQTPQVFDASILRRAYAAIDPFRPEITDDASAVEAAGLGAPALVDGDPENIKITHPADMLRAEAILNLRD